MAVKHHREKIKPSILFGKAYYFVAKILKGNLFILHLVLQEVE